MPRITRSSRRSDLVQESSDIFIGKFTFIVSMRQLYIYLDKAKKDSGFKEKLEALHISFTSPTRYSAASLRLALSLAQGIHRLTLKLSGRIPTTILKKATFPNLIHFTTDIPHNLLVDFLEAHPFISDLTLGPCGEKRDCPLWELDFKAVRTLKCDTVCFPSVIGPRVWLLYLDSLQHLIPPSSFISLLFPRRQLFHVSIEAFPHDLLLLFELSEFAPGLSSLQIKEAVLPSKGPASAQPMWFDLALWSNGLRRFEHLREFGLETWRSPFQNPGSLREEKKVVEGWVSGGEVLGLPSEGHATLRKIDLKYSSGQGKTIVLSCWSKAEQQGEWNRDSSIKKDDYESLLF